MAKLWVARSSPILHQKLKVNSLPVGQAGASPDSPLDAIRLRGVKTHNLKNFDLELPHRKLYCITGVSGSGKSTLLKLITGIERSADGTPQRLKTQEINLKELLKGGKLDDLDDE